jgi:hypothetical protein
VNPTEQSQRTILTVMIVSAGIVLAGRMTVASSHPLRKDGSVFRIGLGTLVGSVMLMGLAKPQPQLAKGFSYLVLLGTVYTYGPVVLAKFRPTLTGDMTVLTEQQWKSAQAKKGKK